MTIIKQSKISGGIIKAVQAGTSFAVIFDDVAIDYCDTKAQVLQSYKLHGGK